MTRQSAGSVTRTDTEVALAGRDAVGCLSDGPVCPLFLGPFSGGPPVLPASGWTLTAKQQQLRRMRLPDAPAECSCQAAREGHGGVRAGPAPGGRGITMTACGPGLMPATGPARGQPLAVLAVRRTRRRAGRRHFPVARATAFRRCPARGGPTAGAPSFSCPGATAFRRCPVSALEPAAARRRTHARPVARAGATQRARAGRGVRDPLHGRDDPLAGARGQPAAGALCSTSSRRARAVRA